MTNTTILKNEMSKKGYTQDSLAKELGISKSRFRRKINSLQEFKASEMVLLVELLELSDEQKIAIFFGNGEDPKVNAY